METNELIAVRNVSVTQLAEEYGFTVKESQSKLDILLENKKMFSYSAGTNTFFIYKNKYSKWLEPDRYLAYIRVCLKNNLPKTISAKTEARYVVDVRGVRFAIYDNVTGSKIESYYSQEEAYRECSNLNTQWYNSIKYFKK